MCLSPRTIKNPSRYISPTAGRLLLDVKCGHCAECKKEAAVEWQFRIFSEYKSFIEHGGFVFFDTLTYDPLHCPLFRGMRVFSRAHIRKFREKLRDKIRYYKTTIMHADGRVEEIRPWFNCFTKDNAKYHFKIFVASEYGGLTHRPHYHILFFVNLHGMTYHLFQQFIVDCWPHGINDHDTPLLRKVVNGVGVMRYISNYVKKEDEFVDTLERHIFIECQKFKDAVAMWIESHPEAIIDKSFLIGRTCEFLENPPEDFPEYGINKEVLRDILPFHVQSQGFGEAIIDQVGKDYIFREAKISMEFPTFGSPVSETSVPMYIQRKLFYNREKDPAGRVQKVTSKSVHIKERYVLNDLGVQWKMLHALRMRDKLAENFERDVANIPCHDDNQRYVYISNLAKDIDFKSLASYLLFYRNKVSTLDLDFSEDYNLEFYYYTLLSPRDSIFVARKDDEICTDQFIRYDELLSKVINNFPLADKFEHFLSVFYKYTSDVNEEKRKAYFAVQRAKDRLKVAQRPELARYISININHMFKNYSYAS